MEASKRRLPAVIICLIALAAPKADAQEPKAGIAEPNTLTPTERADGWVLLFDGKSLDGWQAATDANWKAEDGVISVSEGQPGLLHTTRDFADYEVYAEFRAPAATNSGIFLRTPDKPSDPAVDCYEVNIAPADNPFPTASMVKRLKTESPAPEPDQWHSLQVVATGGRFVVRLDGREALDYTDPDPLSQGRIGLQLNSGRVEFRSIKLRPFPGKAAP